MSAILPVSPFQETSPVDFGGSSGLEGFDGTIVAQPVCAAAPLPPSPYLTGRTPLLRGVCSTPLSLSSTSSSVLTAPCCEKQQRPELLLLPPPRTNCTDSFHCDEMATKKVLCRVSCNDNDYDEEEGHDPECIIEGHSPHLPPTTAASLVFSSTCCSVADNGGQHIHREGQHIVGATTTCHSRDDARASSSAVVPPRAFQSQTFGYFALPRQLKPNEYDDGGLSDDEDDDDYFDCDEDLAHAGGACDASNHNGVDDDADRCQTEWMATGRQGSSRRSAGARSQVEEDRDFITATFDDGDCVSLVVGFGCFDGEGDEWEQAEDAGRDIPGEPHGSGASTDVDQFFLEEHMGDMESSFFEGVSVLGCHDDVSSMRGLEEEAEEDSVPGWNYNNYLNSTDPSSSTNLLSLYNSSSANVHHIWFPTGIRGASHDLIYVTHYDFQHCLRDSAQNRLFDNFSNHDYDNSREADGALFWPRFEGPLAADRTQEHPHLYNKQKSENKLTDRQSVDQNADARERRYVYRHNPYTLSGPVIISELGTREVAKRPRVPCASGEKEQEEEEGELSHDEAIDLKPKIEAQNNKSRKNNNNNSDNTTRSPSANQHAETAPVVIPKLEWCVLVTGLCEEECKVRFPYRSEAKPFPPKPTKPSYPATLAAITPFVKCCYYAQRPHKKCSMLGDACFHAHDDDDGDLVPECFADGLDRNELRSKQPTAGTHDNKGGETKETETKAEQSRRDEEHSAYHDIFVGEGERRRRYISRAELAAAPCQYGERCIVARHSELAKRVGFNKQALSLYTSYIKELRAYTSANLAYRKAVKASRDESEEMYRIQRERREAAEALKHTCKDKSSSISGVPKPEKRGPKKNANSRNDPPLIRDHYSYPSYLYSYLRERQQRLLEAPGEYDGWDGWHKMLVGYGTLYGESVAF